MGSRGREGCGVGQRRLVKKVASELGPRGQMDLGRWRHGGAWNSRRRDGVWEASKGVGSQCWWGGGSSALRAAPTRLGKRSAGVLQACLPAWEAQRLRLSGKTIWCVHRLEGQVTGTVGVRPARWALCGAGLEHSGEQPGRSLAAKIASNVGDRPGRRPPPTEHLRLFADSLDLQP